VLLPFSGIATVNDGRSTIFLFRGGFLIALGLEISGAHRLSKRQTQRRVTGIPGRLFVPHQSPSAPSESQSQAADRGLL